MVTMMLVEVIPQRRGY